MAKKIAWTDQAKADVRAIDRETALDLLHRLARFLSTEEGYVKRLTDIAPPEFGLRLGDYRLRSMTRVTASKSFASVTAKTPTAEREKRRR